MFADWKMVEFLRTSCMGSWSLVRVLLSDLSYASEMFASRDILETGLTTDNLEPLAADRGKWTTMCSQTFQAGETKLKAKADASQQIRKAAAKEAASGYICGIPAVSAVHELD